MMVEHENRSLRRLGFVGVLAVSFGLGCSSDDRIASVGGSSLQSADLAEFKASRRPDPSGQPMLERLIDREVMAGFARRAGLDRSEKFRAKVRAAERELLIQALFEEELADAAQEKVLRARFEEDGVRFEQRRIHVRQILVNITTHPDEGTARAQANMLYARVVSEGDFPVLAATSSEDSVTAAKGGDLGPIWEGQVDSAFFDAAWSLKRGQISLPVRTSWGFHILQAIEDPRVEASSFEEVRGTLAAEARREAQKELQERARKSIKVEIFHERLDEGER